MSTDPRDPQARLLTAPHRCTQLHCGHFWTDTNGQPRLLSRWVVDVVCPHCEGTSSLFAVLHRCRGCGKALESPSGQTWQEIANPCCGVKEIVPSNELLEPENSCCDPETHFQIQCPDCRRDWAALKQHVTRRVVCRDCEFNFPIPRGGSPIRAAHGPAADKHLPCRNCRNHIPVSVTVCPLCRLPAPFGS